MPRYARPWQPSDRRKIDTPAPAAGPPGYDPNWRTNGPAAEVLGFPAQAPKPRPVLECNRIPLRDLAALLEKYGEKSVCRQLNVHRTTVRRWLAGQVQIPGHQLQVIRMLLGHLPGTDGQWAGWSFFQGELVAPNGQAFRAGEVMSIGLNRQRIAALEAEVQRLQVRLAIAEEAERRHAGAANEDLRVRA
jgi:uncharacterized small protein (DUF1192 family)